MDKSWDQLERRCPRLGGPVTFAYCRSNDNNDLPCWKVFDCWWETVDVVAYMKENLTDEQYDGLRNAQPKQKMTSLLELIAKAKKEDATDTEL